MSADDDVPVCVFEGSYEEVLFLKSLIESAGIDASLGSRGIRLAAASVLYVRRADVAGAMDLVNHFRKHGKRTEPW